MTAELFRDWLLKLDATMIRNNRKIALLMDNCSAHNNMPNLKNVKCIFFPPNCTSVLQPLDQGIIRSMKAHYRTRLMQRILINISRDVTAPINIRQAIEMCAGGWWNVTPTVIANCWRKADFLPEEENEESSDEETPTVVEEDATDDYEIQPALWQEISEAFNVPEDVTFEDFVRVDDDVLTARELTDAEVLESVAAEVESVELTEDELDVEEIEDDDNMNWQQALQMATRLQTFISRQRDVPTSVLRSMDEFNQFVEKGVVTQKTVQTKMSDFFTRSAK
jgi:DDE superfamily endonuclease